MRSYNRIVASLKDMVTNLEDLASGNMKRMDKNQAKVILINDKSNNLDKERAIALRTSRKISELLGE